MLHKLNLNVSRISRTAANLIDLSCWSTAIVMKMHAMQYSIKSVQCQQSHSTVYNGALFRESHN